MMSHETTFLVMAILIISCSQVRGKTGACPIPLDPYRPDLCNVNCVRDNDCSGDQLCCRTVCGGWICINPDYTQVRKSGQCPPKSPAATCKERCWHDGDCANISKCCQTVCGISCQVPDNSTITKPGVCVEVADGFGTCPYDCLYDTQCPNDQKCCNSPCGGKSCMPPLLTPFAKKFGACPAPSSKGICKAICKNDFDCPNKLKCCPTACAGGFVCSRPDKK
ncbi:hypothetical protein B566_EDAN014394 [Ephemera danica]|nr:hypothetical protein B566_EDAN014394 [Ephemera danica]